MEISDGFLALISIGILGVMKLFYFRPGRNEALDERKSEQEQIELQGDINRLEFELGIVDKQPESVEINGQRVPVPTRPDPGEPRNV